MRLGAQNLLTEGLTVYSARFCTVNINDDPSQATTAEPPPPSPNTPTFAPDQKLAGVFVLRREVSTEGAERIWLAHDEVLGKDVSLHFIPQALRSDERAMSELRQEIKRNRQLIHPGILRVYDLVEEAEWAAVSMDWFEGESLASRLRKVEKGGFEPNDISGWLRQVCQTLEDVHRIQVVHRNLAPRNILVDASGKVLIAKFGVSRVIEDALGRIEKKSSSDRHLAYVSPQQLDGEPPSKLDDVYALGVTIHELLAGEPPFSGADVVAQIRRATPPAIGEHRAKNGGSNTPIPAAWEKTVAACLAKAPADRPQTAAEVASKLGVNSARPAERVAPAAAAAAASPLAAAAAAALATPPAEKTPAAATVPPETRKAAEPEVRKAPQPEPRKAPEPETRKTREPEAEKTPARAPSRREVPPEEQDVTPEEPDSGVAEIYPSLYPKRSGSGMGVMVALAVIAIGAGIYYFASRGHEDGSDSPGRAEINNPDSGLVQNTEPATSSDPLRGSDPVTGTEPGPTAGTIASAPPATAPGAANEALLGEPVLGANPPAAKPSGNDDPVALTTASPQGPKVASNETPPAVKPGDASPPDGKPEPKPPAASPAPGTTVAATAPATPAPAPSAPATSKPATTATSKPAKPAPGAAPATVAVAGSPAGGTLAERQAAVESARQAVAAAEKAYQEAVKRQQTEEKEAAATEKGLAAREKAVAPVLKASQELQTERQKQEEAVKTADAAAGEARRAAEEQMKQAELKARDAEEAKKALAAWEDKNKQKLAAREKADTELASLKTAAEEKRRAAAEAAQAAAAAQAAREQGLAALKTAEADAAEAARRAQEEERRMAEAARAAEKAKLEQEMAAMVDSFKKRLAALEGGTPAPPASAAPPTPASRSGEPAAGTPPGTPPPNPAPSPAPAPPATQRQPPPAPPQPKPIPQAQAETPAPAGELPLPSGREVPQPPPSSLPPVASAGPAANPELALAVRPPPPGPPLVSAETAARTPDANKVAFENSLGMKFAPVGEVLFSLYPVRVQDFHAFAEETGFKSNSWRNPGFQQGSTHPVVNVSWTDATAFCKWLTDRERKKSLLQKSEVYRLPTDLEWSKAVGLPDETGKTAEARDMGVPDVFPWGTQWPPPPKVGNYTGEETGSDVAIKGYDDGFAWTSPVGSFPANKFGLYDMGGNVWQWCMDDWNAEAKAKVLRGASWYNGALKLSLLSSCRVHAKPDSSTDNYGFRVVKATEAASGRRGR
jgi:hypothetical protein